MLAYRTIPAFNFIPGYGLGVVIRRGIGYYFTDDFTLLFQCCEDCKSLHSIFLVDHSSDIGAEEL
jgi:hypothetical protein